MRSGSARRRWPGVLAAGAVILVAVIVVARWPVTTSVGYNYEIWVKPLTLFEKTVAFLARDLEMRRIASEIGGPDGTPEERLLRMYDWVTRNIHPQPEGLPVVDDHVVNIFVRHYGAPDQRAEALAALATYSGMPATALGLGKLPGHFPVQLTVVDVGGRLVVFDVNHRFVFRTPAGELATLQDLIDTPSIVRSVGDGIVLEDAPYHEHFERLAAVTPSFRRMEQQQLWSRVKNEVIEQLTGR
jgi:hypothetical protein